MAPLNLPFSILEGSYRWYCWCEQKSSTSWCGEKLRNTYNTVAHLLTIPSACEWMICHFVHEQQLVAKWSKCRSCEHNSSWYLSNPYGGCIQPWNIVGLVIRPELSTVPLLQKKMRDIFHTNPNTNIRPENGWLRRQSFHFLGQTIGLFSRANLLLVSGRLSGKWQPRCRWPNSQVLKHQGWLLGTLEAMAKDDLKWMDV